MDFDGHELSSIVDESQTALWEFVSPLSDLLDGYTTGYYRSGHGRNDPTNHAYESISAWLPEAVGGVPTWEVDSDLPGEPEQIADALTEAMARWARATRAREAAERMAVNHRFLFGWCALFMERRLDPQKLRKGERLMWPKLVNIDPDEAILDMAAKTWREGAFCGHVMTNSRKRMLKEGRAEGWIPDEVEKLATLSDSNEQHKLAYRRGQSRKGRDDVAYRVLWCSGATMKDVEALGYRGYDEDYGDELDSERQNGWLFWVGGARGTGEMIRRPEPYFGPATGPYVMSAGLPVMGSPIPLASQVAEESQNRELNEFERALLGRMRKKKTVIGTSGDTDGGIDERVIGAKDMEVVRIPGLMRDGKPAYMLLEFPGPDAADYGHLQTRRDALDRAAGRSDPGRGAVTGKATATENEIAANAGARRSGYQAIKWYEAQGEVGEILADYMANQKEFAIPLGRNGKGRRRRNFMVRDDETGRMSPAEAPVYYGGEEPGTLADMQVRFSYHNAAYLTASERANKAIMEREAVIVGGQAMAVMPFVKWEEFWEDQGELLDIPHLKKRFDYNALAKSQGLVIAAQQAELRVAMLPGSSNKQGEGAKPTQPTPRASGGGGAKQATAMPQPGAAAPKQNGAVKPMQMAGGMK